MMKIFTSDIRIKQKMNILKEAVKNASFLQPLCKEIEKRADRAKHLIFYICYFF